MAQATPTVITFRLVNSPYSIISLLEQFVLQPGTEDDESPNLPLRLLIDLL